MMPLPRLHVEPLADAQDSVLRQKKLAQML